MFIICLIHFVENLFQFRQEEYLFSGVSFGPPLEQFQKKYLDQFRVILHHFVAAEEELVFECLQIANAVEGEYAFFECNHMFFAVCVTFFCFGWDGKTILNTADDF